MFKNGKEYGSWHYFILSENLKSQSKCNGVPVVDENTVIKVEDGPENGIPHFFTDAETIPALLQDIHIISMQHTQDVIVNGKPYGSWHFFILGENRKPRF